MQVPMRPCRAVQPPTITPIHPPHLPLLGAGEYKAYNRAALTNLVSDSVTGSLIFAALLQNNSQRTILFRTIGRILSGLSGVRASVCSVCLPSLEGRWSDGMPEGVHATGPAAAGLWPLLQPCLQCTAAFHFPPLPPRRHR